MCCQLEVRCVCCQLEVRDPTASSRPLRKLLLASSSSNSSHRTSRRHGLSDAADVKKIFHITEGGRGKAIPIEGNLQTFIVATLL